MKDKILYISYDGMTDPLGQSQVLPYLTKLSKKFDIHLLSTEKEENYDKNKNVIADICQEFGITWHTINYTKKPPVLSTIKDILTLRKRALKLHKEHNFDILHCRSYISSLIGLEFQRKFKSGFLFDMRGFWADERVDGKIWNLDNKILKRVYDYFKRKEIEFLENADYVISLTEAGKKEISSWNQLKRKPDIEVIPCCADLDFFTPDNINIKLQQEFKTKLNIQNGDFVISYLGSVGTWYMLDEMLDFFKVLKSERENSKFLFITKDPADSILNKVFEKGINKDDIIIQPCERKDLPSLVSISDLSIFFILPVFSKKASSPTKQAELFGLGIPVLCNDNVGDTGPIVRENNAGMVIDQFNESTYLNAINSIDSLNNISTQHLRQVANSYASLKIGVERYEKVYRDILIKKSK